MVFTVRMAVMPAKAGIHFRFLHQGNMDARLAGMTVTHGNTARAFLKITHFIRQPFELLSDFYIELIILCVASDAPSEEQ